MEQQQCRTVQTRSGLEVDVDQGGGGTTDGGEPTPRELLEQQLMTEGARVTAMERRLLLDDDISPEQRDALEDEFEAALAAYQQLSDQWREQQEREQGMHK